MASDDCPGQLDAVDEKEAQKLIFVRNCERAVRACEKLVKYVKSDIAGLTVDGERPDRIFKRARRQSWSPRVGFQSEERVSYNDE